jgi:hypothetical protein
MKFVYVLASSKNDTYYEQFLLSVTSLRLHNPSTYIIVIVESNTKKNLVSNRLNYKHIISEEIVISPLNILSQKETSRWIKTSLFNYVKGNFIFIDCDTIITENLVYNFPSFEFIGAILDTHVPLSVHHLKNDFLKQKVLSGFSNQFYCNNYFNSGVVFCKDTERTRAFFNLWHKLWIESNKNGVSADQPSFNQASYEMKNIITELNGEWNCQISHNGLPYLSIAKIIHYYATSLISFKPAFRLASTEILSFIKRTGEISKETMNLLENPKSAFMVESRIIADNISLDIIDSAYFSKLLWLRRNHEKLFYSLNKLIFNIKKPGKKKLN